MIHAIATALIPMALGLSLCAAGDDQKTDEKKPIAKVLNIGDKAPELKVSEWVKGDKVEKFEPGKTYVVEFWATWCGPCRASIPHVTDLAHKYKDKVRFIGVDVWEQDVAEVKPFLKEMGDKMDYNVALDDVKGDNPNSGHMAKNWLAAAGENGIPSAFVVHDGTIAWIGHPMEMDKPLEEITAGKWDLAASAKKRTAAKEAQRKMEEVQSKIVGPLQNGEFEACLKAVNEALAEAPALEDNLGPIKLLCLSKLGKWDDALVQGQNLAKKFADQAAGMNFVAWTLIDPENKAEPSAKVATFALETAKRGVELSQEKEPAILDTLARAFSLTGDAAGAVATEEKALKVIEGLPAKERNPGMQAELQKRLEQYRKAVKK